VPAKRKKKKKAEQTDVNKRERGLPDRGQEERGKRV